MAVADKIRRLKSTEQIIEAGPGCVGFWIDSLDRVKFANDQGEVFIIYTPTSVANRLSRVQVRGTFPGDSQTLALVFQKSLSVILSGNTITFTSGLITAEDVGKLIEWSGFSGTIVSLDTATTATVSPSGVDGVHTATVGEEMPDDSYEIVSIVPLDAFEFFSVGDKDVDGFDIYSSNPSSVATILVTVVR